MQSIGKIQLPTYAKGVNQLTRFCVISCPSLYIVIMGTPWIHKMKAVPSTYYQVIKFPTPWGVAEITGDRKVARECY